MTPTDEAKSDESVPTTTKVVIISSVMFVFISYWRVAAVVLCDLASTAFYIGGIVEHSIGPAAPWFIVGVMLFSYAVRSVYIESCSMFVRGGVYRIVKESLGRTTAKLAVAALLFDYVLTGPISGVSAGQYLMSLFFELWTHYSGITITPEVRDFWKAVGSVVIACAITIYFFRLNVIGIHESSDKALKIMVVTTIMGVTILAWSLLTLAVEGPRNPLTFAPTFTPKENPTTGKLESPLGFLEGTSFAEHLTDGWSWLSLIGVIGFFIAFGHSVLAMSGEETLAQIYREVESPKLKNFKKAAFIVFVYSLLLTGGISVLAVVLIPDAVRMDKYGDNLIAGLAMNVYGPPIARLFLNAFVVCVGSLILAGAVNTAIIGSNGVLNRVAEDGVIPDWLLKPHPRFGTTYRLLYVILGLQIVTILISHGDVLLLGEAYAFGVVWSFVFNCLAMLVLRFKDPNRPRGFKVPLNVKIGGIEIPIGLGLIFVILLISAVTNALTKEIATEAGLCFTIVLLHIFRRHRAFPSEANGNQRPGTSGRIQRNTHRFGHSEDFEPDAPVPQSGGCPFGQSPGTPGQSPRRNRSRIDGCRDNDRQYPARRRHSFGTCAHRHLRAGSDERDREAGRGSRKDGRPNHRFDERCTARRDADSPGDWRPGIAAGNVRTIHSGRATGSMRGPLVAVAFGRIHAR